MPVSKSAEKEMRVAGRRQTRNKNIRTLSKTDVKKADKLIATGDIEAAKGAVVAAISTLDKTAEKRILHRNNAARRKSRLMKKLNKAQAAAKPAEEKKKAK